MSMIWRWVSYCPGQKIKKGRVFECINGNGQLECHMEACWKMASLVGNSKYNEI